MSDAADGPAAPDGPAPDRPAPDGTAPSRSAPRPPEGDWLGTPYLRFERQPPFARVTVDRPAARNALTQAMYFGIRYAVRRVDADPELAGLLITGAGDVFIPGGDLGRMLALLDPLRSPGGRFKRIAEILHFSPAFSVFKFHDAHGVHRFSLVADDVFGDPQIS